MNTVELTDLVKRFNDARDSRLKADRAASKLKETEVALKIELIVAIKEAGLERVANVKLAPKVKPVAKDWEAIRAYIIENDAWDLMERRLGQVACRERWEDGVVLPGIDKYPVDDLSIGKRDD